MFRPKPDHGETSYHGSGKLKGGNAVITGGDSGIGRAVFSRMAHLILIFRQRHSTNPCMLFLFEALFSLLSRLFWIYNNVSGAATIAQTPK